MGVLLATMRSRNMAALVLSQRSVVTHLPSDQRANIVQRFQGKSRRADVANALDVPASELPALPKEVGHFLMTDWTVPDPLMVVVDHLDDVAFVDACERGLRLLYPEAKRGTSNSRVNFIHPKDARGILVELVEPASDTPTPTPH